MAGTHERDMSAISLPPSSTIGSLAFLLSCVCRETPHKSQPHGQIQQSEAGLVQGVRGEQRGACLEDLVALLQRILLVGRDQILSRTEHLVSKTALRNEF